MSQRVRSKKNTIRCNPWDVSLCVMNMYLMYIPYTSYVDQYLTCLSFGKMLFNPSTTGFSGLTPHGSDTAEAPVWWQICCANPQGTQQSREKKWADTDAEEMWHLNESLSVAISEKFFFSTHKPFPGVLRSAHLTIVDDLVDLCFVEM